MIMSWTRIFIIHLLVILSFSFVSKISCKTNITIILKHCYDCNETIIDQSSVNYHRSLIKLLSGGIGQQVYEHVGHKPFDSTLGQVSANCDKSLKHVWKSILNGQNWAFKLINSAGKLSPAFLESSVSSFGDYDQCLSINSGGNYNIRGQYCMIDTFPIGIQNEKYNHQRKKIYLKEIPLFQSSPIFMTICLPSNCSTDDVRAVVKNALSMFPLSLSGEISCDTKYSISYANRMDFHKICAIIFIITFISLILICSASTYMFNVSKDSIISKVSIMTSVTKLFHFDENTIRTAGVDLLRVLFVLLGSISHNLTCAEVPLGLWVSSKHSVYNRVFSSPGTQFMINEAGLSSMTLLSGFATLFYGLEMVKKKRFPIFGAILDRYLSYMPAIMCITALDMVWPLTGSGPFFSRVATYITNKCDKNWWLNIFLVQNWLHPLDICVCQTYVSAVVVQLFIFSIPIIFLYDKNLRLARILTYVLVICGYIYQGYINMIHNSTATILIPHNPTGDKTVNYFEWTHMHISAYFPSFFVGFILADHIKNRFQPEGGQEKHKYLLHIGILLNLLATGSPAIYNSWNLLPDSMIPIFQITIRIMFQLSTCLSLLYIFSGELNVDKNVDSVDEQKEINSVPKSSKFWYKINRILAQLSVGYYLGNYFFIRYDFFTSRILFNNSIYDMCKRTVSGLMGMTVMAMFLHIFFIAPLDSVRKHVLNAKREKRE